MTSYLAWLMGWMSPDERKLVEEYAKRLLTAKREQKEGEPWVDPMEKGPYTGPDLRKVEFLPAPELKPGQQRLRLKDD